MIVCLSGNGLHRKLKITVFVTVIYTHGWCDLCYVAINCLDSDLCILHFGCYFTLMVHQFSISGV